MFYTTLITTHGDGSGYNHRSVILIFFVIFTDRWS